MQVVNEIGYYFNCSLSKKVLGCKVNESVYDCLSWCIDNRINIINKGKRNDEITSQHINTLIHRVQYLWLTYTNVLKMASEDRHLFEKCSEDAIEDLKKVGIKFIHSPTIIMKLNHYFCRNDPFPHPNIQGEMDCRYELPFLEMHTEVKIQLREWR